MRKLLSGITLFLVWCSAHAQRALEEAPSSAPSETVDVIWVAIFGVIFLGMIVYFFWYLWMNEKKRGPEEKQPK